ncbi:MAG: hypothetical protein LBF28_03090 [Rickettsiales bacterium]|jgi:hypothetical protein|nr:hypothetical protein [Rickettsiales bacterium]
MKIIYSLPLLACILLTGCNSMHVKPNTLDKNELFYVDRGGYQFQHAIKKHLENRGYKITVGEKRSAVSPTYMASDDSYSILSTTNTGKARYIIQISERMPEFNPLCALNGFWWWRFNLSIADNKTGQELLGWSGRGCANSSLFELGKALDEMEIKND